MDKERAEQIAKDKPIVTAKSLMNLIPMKVGDPGRNPKGSPVMKGFKSAIREQFESGQFTTEQLARKLMIAAARGNLKALQMVRDWAKHEEDTEKNTLEITHKGSINSDEKDIELEDMPKSLQKEYLEDKLKKLEEAKETECK
jgi:hypothetical protein